MTRSRSITLDKIQYNQSIFLTVRYRFNHNIVYLECHHQHLYKSRLSDKERLLFTIWKNAIERIATNASRIIPYIILLSQSLPRTWWNYAGCSDKPTLNSARNAPIRKSLGTLRAALISNEDSPRRGDEEARYLDAFVSDTTNFLPTQKIRLALAMTLCLTACCYSMKDPGQFVINLAANILIKLPSYLIYPELCAEFSFHLKLKLLK